MCSVIGVQGSCGRERERDSRGKARESSHLRQTCFYQFAPLILQVLNTCIIKLVNFSSAFLEPPFDFFFSFYKFNAKGKGEI